MWIQLTTSSYLKHMVSRDFIVTTLYMWPFLLVIYRLLSRSTGVTSFQPCFPWQNLNTGQCNKLHICQQVNKFDFLQYCLTNSYMGHIWIAQNKALSYIYLIASYITVYIGNREACVRRYILRPNKLAFLEYIVLLDAHFARVSLWLALWKMAIQALGIDYRVIYSLH